MRKIIGSFFFLFFFMLHHLQAQNNSATLQSGWGTMNYAVPESPAFKVLGVSSSNIMRPTTTRDIAVSVGNYLGSGASAIPQNLAVEIAPSLFNPSVSLNDFSRKRWWYTSAFSIGTRQNADGSYGIGLGIRVRLVDKADLRLDTAFLHQLDEVGLAVSDIYYQVTRQMALDMAAQTRQPYPQMLEQINHAYQNDQDSNHTTIKKQIDDQINQKVAADKIASLRNARKNVNWNKMVWDLGVGTLLNSKDSLVKNISAPSLIGLWSTAGFPVFGQKGQLLIGINGQLKDSVQSSLKVWVANVGSRLYYGSNDFKGFAEAELNYQTAQAGGYRTAIGFETTFFGGLWVDFSMGIQQIGNQKAIFSPAVNFRLANGEKTK